MFKKVDRMVKKLIGKMKSETGAKIYLRLWWQLRWWDRKIEYFKNKLKSFLIFGPHWYIY